MLRGMTGANGIVLSPDLAAWLGADAASLQRFGIAIEPLDLFYGPPQAIWIAALMFIVLFAPNSQQLMGIRRAE